MNKFLIILLLFIICQFQLIAFSWAEIRAYSLNKIEVTDGAGNVKLLPLLTDESKPMTMNLNIAGLGTNRVSAQCGIFSLALETQIFPMEKHNSDLLPRLDDATDKAKWFYVRHDQGVTLIELKGDDVKVHNLGLVPYTYVGKRQK